MQKFKSTTKNSRFSQYKENSYLIRHDSLFKAAWDWVILTFVIYTAIEIPFMVTFVLPRQTNENLSQFGALEALSPIAIVNFLVDMLFIIDIPINFLSAVVNKDTDEVVTNAKTIAILYLKTWFLVDFVAAIPFEYMIDPEHEGATTLMGLLKTARLLRLVRVTRKIDRYSEYGVAVVALLTCLFTLFAHWMACVWHAVGTAEAKTNSGWLAALAEDSNKPINQSVPASGPSLSTRYITSLYFTLSSLTSVGFGNIAPSTNNEKIFAVCIMIIGAIIYASIFGNLAAIIQRLYSHSTQQHQNLHLIRDFVRLYQIPKSLKDSLESQFKHEWSFSEGVDMESVLRWFPDSLQTDIRLHIHHKLFEQGFAFHTAVPSCQRSLATKLKVRRYLPGQYVVKQGDEVNKVLFILKGVIQVIEDGKNTLSLGSGDTVYSDYTVTLLGRNPRAVASMLVESATEIHFISWQDLHDVLDSYPRFKEDFLAVVGISFKIGKYVQDEESDVVKDTVNGGPETKTVTSDYQETRLSLDKADLKYMEAKLDLLEKRLIDMENTFSLMYQEIVPVLRQARSASELAEDSRRSVEFI